MLKDERVTKFARVGKIKQRKSRKKIERDQKYSEARNDVTGADVDRKIPFRFFHNVRFRSESSTKLDN